MPVRKGQLRLLSPYLIGEAPKGNGEWDMFCPLHGDNGVCETTRSASLNVYSALWHCNAGCGGGTVVDLIKARTMWLPPGPGASSNGSRPREQAEELVNNAMVAAWHQNLKDDHDALLEIKTLRGLTLESIERFEIGWDRGKRCYTIPVRDPEGGILNVRRYNPHPAEGKRKIWGLRGRNSPVLYPIEQLENDTIIFTEGEWDAIVTIQHGYPAITRTAAATVWYPAWAELFRDKTVYICQDKDKAGRIGTLKIGRGLEKVARSVRVIDLPFEYHEKHGKDLTDFWMEYGNEDFERLLTDAKPFGTGKPDESEPELISILDSFDARRIGKPVNLIVTIKGKKEPGYTIPRTAQLTCTRDAGAKCAFCPMRANGEATVTINGSSPTVLALIDSKQETVIDAIRQEYGAQKCSKLVIEVQDYQGVEVLYGRPSLDHVDGTQAGSYKTIRITSVGRHDTMPNNTVLATGSLYPNPRSQANEFLAWRTAPVDTSLDNFELDPAIAKQLKRFQSQSPAKKLREIAEAMGEHVTRIIGRWELHAIIDLTLHSALSFKFNNKVIHRGWMQSIIYGDTRTGKSEAAAQLIRHYRLGEMVGGESASYAGLIGGLQQLGNKEWIVTWGVIPLNDRRAVVIDEITGLSYEDINHMSDVRSSGVVKIQKIQADATHARTRMLWLANPRDGGHMGHYTYGVDALRPLIGNMEDIARFDLAMAVTMHDIPVEEYNKSHVSSELKYTSELCHQLLLWAWTRTPDQIVWAPGSEKLVMKLATELGKAYVADPPLVQAADVREKIARLSVALAARLYATDKSGERLIVTPRHVEDAVKFLNHVYAMPTFGYKERSDEAKRDYAVAAKHKDSVKKYLLDHRPLVRFLRSGNGRFRRQDLEEILDIPREEANSIIAHLWARRMIRKVKGDILVEPTLVDLLRGIK